jgi:hypothetical protein
MCTGDSSVYTCPMDNDVPEALFLQWDRAMDFSADADRT